MQAFGDGFAEKETENALFTSEVSFSSNVSRIKVFSWLKQDSEQRHKPEIQP